MEFLVEFEVTVPDGTPETQVATRQDAAPIDVTPLEPHRNDPGQDGSRS